MALQVVLGGLELLVLVLVHGGVSCACACAFSCAWWELVQEPVAK